MRRPRIARDLLDRLRLARAPLTYNQDGLASVHDCAFMSAPRFSSAYLAGKRTGSWGEMEIHWRAHVACWAAARGASLAGDFVECGVNRGGLALATARYVGFENLDKKYYLLDTYDGLVDDLISAGERQSGIKAGGYSECYDDVKSTFADYQNVELVRGAVPDTLGLVKSDAVAYLSIDMNCVEPEVAAATFFWPKMSVGAVMVLDDYGWPGHTAQRVAFDRFAEEHDTEVLCLPTGQGLIVK